MTFASYHLHCYCSMHKSHDCRQSPLKALLNTFGMSHKTHGMVTRYGSQDTKDIPDTQDSTPLYLPLQDHPVLEGDVDSSDEYCGEPDTLHPLADLLEQFQQLNNQFASLNLKIPNPLPQKNCLSSQISYSISPWCSNQPPSPVRN